jgi:AbrB family looped-hinge helix DNA binding protein
MRTTIDRAGRLVIPKCLRDEIGLRPGDVEISVHGAGLWLEALAGDSLEERGGRLFTPAGGGGVDELVG